MEFLLQIILEPLFFAYFDLVENFTDGKKLKRWQEYLLKIACVIVSTVAIILVLIGLFWIFDVEPFKTCGINFLVIGGSILFIHILIGLFAGANNFVERKREEDILNREIVEEPEPRISYVETDDSADDNI